MDWEKQDNELRRLLEGDSFLPENETWNAKESWKKLQQKKQPVKRRMMPVWLRLSAAACVAGMLGVGIWYFQAAGPFSAQGEALVNMDKSATIKSEESKENVKAQTLPEIVPASTRAREEQVHSAAGGKHVAAIKSPAKPGFQQHGTNTVFNGEKTKNTTQLPEPGTATAAIEKQPGTGVSSGVQSEPAAVMPDALSVLPAPVKKSRPRVVHYNQLSGIQSTPPPAFVQTKKNNSEWEGLVVQSATNQTDKPFQLKIDISPAHKKSL